MKKLRGILCVAGACGFLLAVARGMSRSVPDMKVSAWLVYWNLSPEESLVSTYRPHLNDLAIFGAHFEESGNLIPANDWVASYINDPQKTAGLGLPCYLTIVNDVLASGGARLKDPALIDQILSSPERRKKHVDQLVLFSNSFTGIEIDYENMWFKDKDLFTVFVRELAAELHQRGKKLSIVVQPRARREMRDGAGAIDWAEISKHADLVKIMAYYYHHGGGPPGPLAPPSWIRDMARYALSEIPKDKLVMAFSFQSYDWPAGSKGRTLTYQQARDLASVYGRAIERDSRTFSPHYTYEENGISHEVWFEDSKSILKKVKVLQEEGVSQIAFWWLGPANQNLWKDLIVSRD